MLNKHLLQAYGALIALVTLTPCWHVMVTHMAKRANLNSEIMVSHLQSEIEYSVELLQPMKSSSTNLARLLSSALDSTNTSSSDIGTKVGQSSPSFYFSSKSIKKTDPTMNHVFTHT